MRVLYKIITILVSLIFVNTTVGQPNQHADANKPLSKASKARFESFVHDYILNNPEVIEQAYKRLQAKRRTAYLAQIQHSIWAKRAQIFGEQSSSQNQYQVVLYLDKTSQASQKAKSAAMRLASRFNNVQFEYKTMANYRQLAESVGIIIAPAAIIAKSPLKSPNDIRFLQSRVTETTLLSALSVN